MWERELVLMLGFIIRTYFIILKYRALRGKNDRIN